MLRVLTSIKTAVLFFGASILFFFSGTLIIPRTMELYTGIIDTVLFQWLQAESLTTTWWIYGVIISLALMSINTVICSVDALIRKLGAKDFLRVLAPQVVHLGVLLILLGHLLTSASGLRKEAVVTEGQSFEISHNTGFRVEDISVTPSETSGVDWEIKGQWLDAGGPVEAAVIRPSGPSYFNGFWVFVKSADTSPQLQAILMVRRDTGAYWAGCGGLVFALGCAMTIYAGRGRKFINLE